MQNILNEVSFHDYGLLECSINFSMAQLELLFQEKIDEVPKKAIFRKIKCLEFDGLEEVSQFEYLEILEAKFVPTKDFVKAKFVFLFEDGGPVWILKFMFENAEIR